MLKITGQNIYLANRKRYGWESVSNVLEKQIIRDYGWIIEKEIGWFRFAIFESVECNNKIIQNKRGKKSKK